MTNHHYERLVVAKIEENLDKIMPFGAVAAIISGIAIIFSNIPISFMVLDFAIAIVLIILTLVKKRTSVKVKTAISIGIPVVVGVLSFYDGGFNSGGVILLLISNVIATIFLERKHSITYGFFTIMVFVFLWVTTSSMNIRHLKEVRVAEWIIQLIIYILFLAIIHIVFYSVRKYLITNIEELELSIKRSDKLAYYDQLTGLPNINLFRKRLNDGKGSDCGYMVLYNINNLNIINSVYSSDIGDLVLIETSKIFEKFIKGRYMVARVSGNEFAVWFEGLEEVQVIDYIEEINEAIEKELRIKEEFIKTELFISYAPMDKDLGMTDCYRKVNSVMTYSKTHNLSGLVPYNQHFEKVIRQKAVLKEEVKKAIASRAFTINYQEKVDGRHKKVVGVEALARWTSEVIGVVSPAVFVPVIESINESIRFGEQIIEGVFRDYEKLTDKYKDNLSVSINISPNHLISGELIVFLETAVEKYKLNPKNIILEITEEVLIDNKEEIIVILQEIRSLGFRISLDDFGTGYSSFNYLMLLDVDELKIDKSFIDQLDINTKTRTLLESILHAAKGLNLDVVAEGVETERQCSDLLDLGCHIIQGYYFSKPMPLSLEVPIET